MKSEKISESLEYVDPALINEAEDCVPQVKKNYRMKWGLIAACIAVILVIGSAATVFAVEAKEYNDAVAFFEDNGLSAEGLSRAEVKAVYRDITTKSFKFEKTADIIKQSVYGYEIEQVDKTPEDAEEIWNKNFEAAQKEYGYKQTFHGNGQMESGLPMSEKTTLEYYEDGKLIWTADFAEESIEKTVKVNDVTMVLGNKYVYSSTEIYPESELIGYVFFNGETYESTKIHQEYTFAAFIDGEGKVFWKAKLNHASQYEQIISVFENEDGSRTVFSRADRSGIMLTKLDENGNELSAKKLDVSAYLEKVARFYDGGYLVQVSSLDSEEADTLLKVDKDGNIFGDFTYESEDTSFLITDFIEFGGQIYLSAVAADKQNSVGWIYVSDKEQDAVSVPDENYDEQFTADLRESYTAILLVCDSEGGTPTTFYSVKGAFGAGLSVNDEGNLEWKVQTIATAYPSYWTNSYSMAGTCEIFRYTFDLSGKLIDSFDTGKIVGFRR